MRGSPLRSFSISAQRTGASPSAFAICGLPPARSVGFVAVRVDREEAAYRSGHRTGNRLITGFVAHVFGRSIGDMLSGYRAFSRRFVKTMPVLSGGFEIETEMTVFALANGFTLSECTVEYGKRPDGSHSKLNTYRDGMRVLKTIFFLFKDLRPLLFFGVLALSSWLEDENGRTPASEKVSFLRELDWFVLPMILALLLIWLLVAGFSNAVNLTDGLDGLAAGACAMVFGAYTLVNIWQNNQFCQDEPSATCYNVRDPLDLAVIGAAITGACFGFLWWNASPARIFMGDTGSLALGSALAGFAILTRTELLLVILGGLFVLETVSVMMQVAYFKYTKRRFGEGRRLFKMAPLHHHFELLGWSETQVSMRFWMLSMMGRRVFWRFCIAVSVFSSGLRMMPLPRTPSPYRETTPMGFA